MHCVQRQRKRKHRTWPKRIRDKDTNSRRRRGPGTRTTSEPILLFVQGECTEKDYFALLKRRLRLSSLTIKTESQSPENLIKQTKTTISRDKNAPFSAIYYVVDVDETSDKQFNQAFKAAKDATNRKTEYHFVVSHECFEAWLLAHFEDIRNKNIPRTTMGKTYRVEKCSMGQAGKTFQITSQWKIMNRLWGESRTVPLMRLTEKLLAQRCPT